MATSNEISADFPFESKYVEVHGSKMHYIDEGAGDPILFLHGQPTSSYVWRNVIPHLTPARRCIALDLIGFGKSDKPDIEYRFFDHVRYVDGFIEKMGLKNLTLVLHDWGSALGFHYARRNPDNVQALVFMEALLSPIPSWDTMPEKMRESFQQFRAEGTGWDLLVNRNVFVEGVMPRLIKRELTEEEMNTYREPFKDPSSRKPVWRWPNEAPIEGHPADVAQAVEDYAQWLQQTDKPKLLLYADPGATITPQRVEPLTSMMNNLTTVHIGEGLHYVQEDNPHGIGRAIADWVKWL